MEENCEDLKMAQSREDRPISFDLNDSIDENGAIVIVNNSLSQQSGSLSRDVLSKQAMRTSVAEELGIPSNSDIALQAVADFERSINAKLDAVDDASSDGLGCSSTHGSTDSLSKRGIPDDFVS